FMGNSFSRLESAEVDSVLELLQKPRANSSRTQHDNGRVVQKPKTIVSRELKPRGGFRLPVDKDAGCLGKSLSQEDFADQVGVVVFATLGDQIAREAQE